MRAEVLGEQGNVDGAQAAVLVADRLKAGSLLAVLSASQYHAATHQAAGLVLASSVRAHQPADLQPAWSQGDSSHKARHHSDETSS